MILASGSSNRRKVSRQKPNSLELHTDGTVAANQELGSLVGGKRAVQLLAQLGERVNDVGDALGGIEAGNLNNVVPMKRFKNEVLGRWVRTTHLSGQWSLFIRTSLQEFRNTRM